VQLLIDEAGKFLSNRFWAKLDPRTLTMLQERRKMGRGVDIHATVPHFRHVDPQLRDVCQQVHLCKRIGGSEYSHDGGRPPRFFIDRTYRPEQLTTDGSRMVRKKEKPIRRRIVPFSKDLAALYGTAVLDMTKPMLTGDRPDYRDTAPADEGQAVPIVQLQVVKPKKRGRG
jgi:Zonular occludens toxin (Zot)